MRGGVTHTSPSTLAALQPHNAHQLHSVHHTLHFSTCIICLKQWLLFMQKLWTDALQQKQEWHQFLCHYQLPHSPGRIFTSSFLHQDVVVKLCQTDEFIISVGKHLYGKSRKRQAKQQSYVHRRCMQDMHQLGCLALEFKKWLQRTE